ncbi:hypothetical protein [Limimaricola soesokkakensis]|uniref:hypothetical protein n=1 Tax=Limimaricola soesokkakensis TaxID=1343159 RepID=UPI001054CA93|nr:hypothetical protein [Limimaricola soesokkakensis]
MPIAFREHTGSRSALPVEEAGISGCFSKQSGVEWLILAQMAQGRADADQSLELAQHPLMKGRPCHIFSEIFGQR